MADPVGFEGSNAIMYGFGNVRDLQVFKTNPAVETPQIVSAWRLSQEEIDEIVRTGIIWASIYSTGMPPIYISGKALVLVNGVPSRAEPVIPHKPARGPVAP